MVPPEPVSPSSFRNANVLCCQTSSISKDPPTVPKVSVTAAAAGLCSADGEPNFDELLESLGLTSAGSVNEGSESDWMQFVNI